jgi:hypothetical protein
MDCGTHCFVSLIYLSYRDDSGEFIKEGERDQHEYSISASGGRYLRGTGKLCECDHVQGIFEKPGIQFVHHNFIRRSNPALLFDVCVVYHKSQQHFYEDFILSVCIFHGCAIPDGYVYTVADSR